MADATPLEMPKCANCNKTAKAGGTSLSLCSQCRKASYCSKDCQKANWKIHKIFCGPGGSNGKYTNSDGSKSSGSIVHGLLGATGETWLHSRPEPEVYTLLIDSYRMRIEDECNFRGEYEGIYDGGDPVPGFRRFLQKAERAGVLPSWWNKAKQDACIAKGIKRHHWSCLHFKVEKSDIQEHYKNPTMPMQLRMLAEQITGSNVMAFG